MRSRKNRRVCAQTIIALLAIVGTISQCQFDSRSPEEKKKDIVAHLKKNAKHRTKPTGSKEDYTKVYFVRNNMRNGGDTIFSPDERLSLYEIGSDGKGLREVFRAKWIRWTVEASPDGEKYAFVGKKDSSFEAMIIYFEKTGETRVFRQYKHPDYPKGDDGAPRWWDNDHIYHHSNRIILKRNIHTGKLEELAKKDLPSKTYPFWIPDKKRFVNVGSMMCRFDINGEHLTCDSLKYDPVYSRPPTITAAFDKIGYYGRYPKVGLDGNYPKSYFVRIDLNSGQEMVVSMDSLGTSQPPAMGPYGKWIYYLTWLPMPESQNSDWDYSFMRHRISDGKAELILNCDFPFSNITFRRPDAAQ
ncbi:MAG: hypothetical protein GF344_19435 [Chitinivibrionales bacterium]|nr:hypothetical protein [Chitinivibrionales bacterium]MBD3358799.1 hypothetical protein [Chitinivibrionales bacterium]